MECDISIDFSDLQVQQLVGSSLDSAVSTYTVTVSGWRCAMKEVKAADLSSEEALKLLLEINTLRRLPFHPNVVQYLHHIKTSTSIRLFTTMYSQSLAQKLSMWKTSSYRPDLDGVVQMTLDIVKGLALLHRHEIIHRNIKSSNIFVVLTPRKTVKRLVIGDFDSCKHISATKMANTIVGTAHWMAPELLLHQPYTKAVDIWSFGIVLFELMTFEHPYKEYPGVAVFDVIRRGERPTIPANFSSALRPLLSVWNACLTKNPNDRPSADSLFSDICAALI